VVEGLRRQDPHAGGAIGSHDARIEPEAHKEQPCQGGGQAGNGGEERLPGLDLVGEAHPIAFSPHDDGRVRGFYRAKEASALRTMAIITAD
jgi:hypothetical protein